MPLYRMTKPTAANPDDRPFTEEPFEASTLGEALEHSCRRVMVGPDHFGSHPGGLALVTVEHVDTGRSVSECVRFLPDDVVLLGDPHI